jgi:surface antigen
MEPFMRHLFSLTLAALFTCSLLASPAYADRDDRHRGHHGHHYKQHHKHYYKHHNKHHHWRQPRNHLFIYSTAPHVSYYTLPPQPVYAQPAYREIRCTNSYNPLGMLLGGAAGGIVGNQFGKGSGRTAATIGGAVLGGALGAGAASRHCSEYVFHDVPVGTPVSWQSASAQEFYSVTPLRDFNTEGRYCREYQARASVGGRSQQTYGTACMQPDGSWQVMN